MGIVEDVHEAAAWVAAALTSSGYRADFSPGSLWEVERFFEVEAPDGRPRPDGLLARQLGARLFAVGSYVGEVIRRNAGGTWSGDDNDPAAEINVALQQPDGGRIWPVQRVMKRYSNGAEDSITAYGAVLGLDIGARPGQRRRRWFR
ncbi:hypothetical protein OHA72_35100 [Dactylosporangium sp. NBC_01737]|uniref:hypothetical protein n=1 Tax=Dactylosporangium sp. NBC_01737 TaxID=2975959 RepID=UPI002E1576F5|nr:hypothetical protein OHA72_35100 [Dactylosporangium sp. NBC_01737]